MRITVSYNAIQNDTAFEPGYTAADTLESVLRAIKTLGHQPTPVELSGSLPDVVTALRNSRPELVFTLAEGARGGWRQAFYPHLYTDLGMAHTGSPAPVLALALDKHLTKLVAASHDIDTPQWQFLRRIEDLDTARLPLPAIVKPNFEGWSTGIDSASIVHTPADAAYVARKLLDRFPDGVLVEQFITGRDITVAYLETVESGALTPVEYVYPTAPGAHPGYGIYHFDLKNRDTDQTGNLIPAPVPDRTAAELARLTRRIVAALGCRDMARADFRLGPDDTPYLLEVNAAPNLEPSASFHTVAARAGLHPEHGVVEAIIESACRRYRLDHHRRAVEEEGHGR